MMTRVFALFAALFFTLPARSEPTLGEAVLIKQFLICEGPLAKGCNSFVHLAFADAMVEFSAAAATGNAEGQNNLAMLHETGAGVPVNEAEALRLYRIAAEAGLAIAQYNFAMLVVTKHVIGEVTDPVARDEDMAVAYMWLTFASEQGLDLATESRAELTEFMTGKALASAENRIRARRGK